MSPASRFEVLYRLERNVAALATEDEQEVEATKQAIIDWFHNL